MLGRQSAGRQRASCDRPLRLAVARNVLQELEHEERRTFQNCRIEIVIWKRAVRSDSSAIFCVWRPGNSSLPTFKKCVIRDVEFDPRISVMQNDDVIVNAPKIRLFVILSWTWRVPFRSFSFATFLLGTVLSFFEVFAWVFFLILSEPRVPPPRFYVKVVSDEAPCGDQSQAVG